MSETIRAKRDELEMRIAHLTNGGLHLLRGSQTQVVPTFCTQLLVLLLIGR